MPFLDDLGKKISQTGQDTVKKAKDLADVTRLNGQLTDAGRLLEGYYGRLGERYFALHQEDAQAELLPLCKDVAAALEKISTLHGEIQRIKNIKVCPACGCENPPNAAFCAQCSAKLPEVPRGEDGGHHCPTCGGAVADGARFCTKCGSKIEP